MVADWVAMLSCRDVNCAAMSAREGSGCAGAGGAAAAATCLAASAALVPAPVAIGELFAVGGHRAIASGVCEYYFDGEWKSTPPNSVSWPPRFIPQYRKRGGGRGSK